MYFILFSGPGLLQKKTIEGDIVITNIYTRKFIHFWHGIVECWKKYKVELTIAITDHDML